MIWALTGAAVVALLLASVHPEHRTPTRVAQTPTAPQTPMRVLFLGDHSRSQTYAVFGRPLIFQAGKNLMAGLIAEGLAASLPPAGALRVASFSQTFRVSPAWVTAVEDIRRAFDSVGQPFGASAIWDALHAAVSVFDGEQGQKFILLVSDGMASGNVVGFEEALARVREAGVTVHTVYLNHLSYQRRFGTGSGDPVDRVKRFAAETGGQHREVELQRLPDTVRELMRLTAAGADRR